MYFIHHHSSLFYLIVLLSKLFLNKLIDLKIDWLYSVSGPKQTSFINLGRHLLFYSILWWRGFKFNIGITYLVHGSIAMRQCVAYIQNLDTTLIFDIKAKLIVFLTWLCVRVTAYLSYHVWHMVASLDNVSHAFMTSVWRWPLASIPNLSFHLEFVSRQDRLFIPNLAHGCMTMRQRVVSVHDHDLWYQG